MTDGDSTNTALAYTFSGELVTGVSSATGNHPAVDKTLDQAGRMTQLLDQNGSIYGFSYDRRDLVTEKTDPFHLPTQLVYRNDGRLGYILDRNGDATVFTYTPSGKTAGITYPEGSVTFAYDAHDRLSYMTDSLGQAHYVYDGHNRLQSVTDAQNATVGYSYDPASNITRLTYPDGRTVSYTYDALNRVNTVTIDWLSRTATYSYDDAGRLAGLTQFNGTTVTYGYDDANRMISLVNSAGLTTIAGYNYTLDGNGNRTQIVTAGALPATGQAGGMDYTYTDRGNRLIYTGLTRLTYDQEGQLANNGSTPYTFDGMHRLTGYGTSSFSYDGAGRRLSATRSGTTGRYVHDASGNLLVEKDANGNILKYFIYGKGCHQ